MENNFTVNEDYKTTMLPKEHGQFTSKEIMLNTDIFKNLCMIVKTNQGKKIRKYYVKLENIYNNILKDEIKLKELELVNERINIKNTLFDTFNKKEIVYLIKIKIKLYLHLFVFILQCV